MSWFRWDHADLILNVKIQPGASRNEFAGLYGANLRLRIHASAIEGRANDELIMFLCERFATARHRVAIERGASSRIKSLRIQIPSQLPAELVMLGLIDSTSCNSHNLSENA